MTLQVHKLILWIASAGPWGHKGNYWILKVLQPCKHPGHFPIVSWWRGKEPRNFWEIKHSAFIHSTHILNILMWNSIIWIDVIFGRIWPPPCCISANFLPITPKTQIHAVPGTSSTGWAHWSPRYQAVVPSVGRSSAPKRRPWSKLHGLGGANNSGQVISYYSILPS